MADPKATITITSGAGNCRLKPATSLLSVVFAKDPVIAYMLLNLSPTERANYMYRYFHILLTAASHSGASFDETNDWKCCGILVPPGKRVDSSRNMIRSGLFSVLHTIGLKGFKRMVGEYVPLADRAKAKALKGRKAYYYVFFLGTDPDARSQGLASALIRKYQSQARADGHPIWLEATTDYSRGLYARLGFEVVDEIVIGKGTAAADGTASAGGEGVKVWGMIWEPETKGKEGER